MAVDWGRRLCLAWDRDAGAGWEGKWVTTHRWQGAGTRQTEMFWVNGRRWRVRHRHKGPGLFQIMVYDAQGHLLDVAANQTEPIPGVKTMEGRGYRFLAINGVNTQWEVTVQQYMTLAEQWQWHELSRKPGPRLRRYAVWTGEDVDTDYTITIPRGSWKIIYDSRGTGVLQVSVRKKGSDRAVLAVNAGGVARASSWVHAAGTFTVHVTAMQTHWKIEIFGQ